MPALNNIVTIFMLLAFTTGSKSQKTFSAKAIEGNMAKVSDSLYAHRYEISNKEYNFFLTELCTKDPSIWTLCIMDSARWDISYPPMETIWPHYTLDPAFNDYPATNMRYEGAIEYCKWLTEKYNADPKRKFKKALFMLPSEKERVQAAQGGRSQSMFPWGNYYLVNKKGFYMCNFKPVGDAHQVRDSTGKPMIVNYNGRPTIHSAEFPPEKTFYTMKVRSFFANGLGLYNMSGNVAEMIAEPGYAMGGSWNSYGGEVYTKSIKRYDYPSPEVGFRVFMKVIVQ